MTKNSDEPYTPFNEEPGFFGRNYTTFKKKSIVIYERIKNRKGGNVPDRGGNNGGGDGGGDGNNKNIPPSPKPPKERSPKIHKILNCIPCAVVGILAGAVISQAAPGTQRPISNALHAIGVEQTAYDLQKSYELKNKEILANLGLVSDEGKKMKEELTKTKAEYAKMKADEARGRDTIALLNQKLKQMEYANKKTGAQGKGAPNVKRVAEAKQKIISTKLKELLRLQGKKPALKNEGIPRHITNYADYIPKQDRSIRVIERKIKEQRSIKSEAKLATKIPSAHRKKVTPIGKSKALERRAATESSVVGILATPHAAPPEHAAPLGGSRAVSSGVLANTYGSNASSLLAPRMQLFVPLDGIYSIPLTKTQGAFPWAVPMESGTMSSDTPKDMSRTALTETMKAQDPASAKTPPVGAITQRQPVDKKIATPPPTSLVILKESGLDAENVTPEKLQSFIDHANKTIRSLPGNHPLKGTSLTMKPVKVKGVPSLRILLKHGNRSSYFTIRPGQKSRNYEYLSSESKLMAWAEMKVKKWGTRAP